MLNKEGKLLDLFSSKGSLRPYWEDFKTAFALLSDVVTGKYKLVPWRVIAAISGGLLYVLSPIDLIPDLIPIAGFLDDAAVFGFIVRNIASGDLEKYRAWRGRQNFDA